MDQSSNDQSSDNAAVSSRRGFLRSSTVTGLLAAPLVGMLAGNARGVFDGDADEATRRKAKIRQNFK